MARKRGFEYIPNRDDDFFTFQGKLINMVVANKAAWGIPDSAITPLIDRRTKYEPLYHKSQIKNNRTSVDVAAHRQSRQLYEKEIRGFVNSYLRFNPAVSPGNKVAMALVVPDTEPSPRPAISTSPVVGFTILGGGEIKVVCKEETDQTRPSMHPAADAVECRFTLIQKGQTPPKEPDECPNVQMSKKAQFIINCGVKNAGNRFYGFFRWVNLTNPSNNGHWSNAQTVIIA